MKQWLALAAAAATWSCSSDSAKTGSTPDTAKPAAAMATGGGVDLTGAGATFPHPLYNKWISEYAAKTGVKINYQAIGSGGGIRQFTEGTVDFGATDAPMSDEEMAKPKVDRPFTSRWSSGSSRSRTTFLRSRNRSSSPARRRRHLPRQDHEVERRAESRR